ncbi:MAG: chromosomal replication initiator protein DnaA [Eubacterium sp.]|nr:chromosomal replication initiator protein DnaA [Eubacterium sp.]
MNSLKELWQSILDYCREKINDTVYNVWLSDIELVDFQERSATLLFPSKFKKDTVIQEFGTLLEEAFKSVCGFQINLIYECPEERITNEEDIKTSLEDLKNEKYTFDNFIDGPSNKFAYTAAKAIAADPGGQMSNGNNIANYNPLFIYGASGLGKTHLLNAISNEVKHKYPELKVVFVRTEEFANEFIEALGNKTINEFHEKYRNNIDVFLVDDIQFIAGKTQTEEEFFHTFNALVDKGKQVVLTSDRPPKEIHSLTDRLRSRFVSGLLADIQFPEFETRCAIIKRKAELLNFKIDDNIVEFIANNVKSNIRQLEGITKKLYANYNYGGEMPTISTARAAIKDVKNDVIPLPVTISRVVDEVSRTTGISVEDIYSKKRKANISTARKMCIYIIRNVTDMSFNDIGEEFKRDHTTVIYNYDEMEKKIHQNTTLNSQVLDIINNIKDEQ